MAVTAALASAILHGAGAVGGAALGGYFSGRYNRKADKDTQSILDDNTAWWNIKRSTPVTERVDAQALLTRQRQMLDEQYKRTKAAGVVAGGTDEAIAMQKQGANESLAETASNIAAAGAAEKERAEAQARRVDTAIRQQQIEDNRQMARESAEAASQLVNAGISGVGRGVYEHLKNKA